MTREQLPDGLCPIDPSETGMTCLNEKKKKDNYGSLTVCDLWEHMIALAIRNTDHSRLSQGRSCWAVQIPRWGREWISQELQDPHWSFIWSYSINSTQLATVEAMKLSVSHYHLPAETFFWDTLHNAALVAAKVVALDKQHASCAVISVGFWVSAGAAILTTGKGIPR